MGGCMDFELALTKAVVIAVGGFLAPGSLLITLLLFNTPAGVRTAASYLGGYIAGYLGIGAVALALGLGAASEGKEGPSVLGSSLYIALGCLLLFLFVKTWRGPAAKETEPKVKTKPGFFDRLGLMTPTKAFFFGIVVTSLNVKNLAIFLSSMAVLSPAFSSTFEATIGLVSVVAVFCGALFVPFGVYFAFPERSEAALANLRDAVERHKRPVMLSVLGIFGTGFLVTGLSGLLG